MFKAYRDRDNTPTPAPIPNLYCTHFIGVGINIGLGRCDLAIKVAWRFGVKITFTIRDAENHCLTEQGRYNDIYCLVAHGATLSV